MSQELEKLLNDKLVKNFRDTKVELTEKEETLITEVFENSSMDDLKMSKEDIDAFINREYNLLNVSNVMGVYGKVRIKDYTLTLSEVIEVAKSIMDKIDPPSKEIRGKIQREYDAKTKPMKNAQNSRVNPSKRKKR